MPGLGVSSLSIVLAGSIEGLCFDVIGVQLAQFGQCRDFASQSQSSSASGSQYLVSAQLN